MNPKRQKKLLFLRLPENDQPLLSRKARKAKNRLERQQEGITNRQSLTPLLAASYVKYIFPFETLCCRVAAS
jgi:hypothetical protein